MSPSTAPSAFAISSLGIDRSPVPAAIVTTASIICESPKKRMNDSISGSLLARRRGTIA